MSANDWLRIGATSLGLLAGASFAAKADTLAEFEADPTRVLQYHFQNYQTVQFCHQARHDLAFQYTTDDDLTRARGAIKIIDEGMRAEHPGLDPEAIWQKALDEFGDPKTMPAGYRDDPISKTHLQFYWEVMAGDTGFVAQIG